MKQKAIIEFANEQMEFSCIYYDEIKDYHIVYELKISDDRDNVLKDLDFDTVIIINNLNVNYSFAYDVVKKYLENHKKVITYFVFTNKDICDLKSYAKQMKTEISFHYVTNFTEQLSPIPIPVIYITGMGTNCSQFNMHLHFYNIFKSKSIKTLNYTNSVFGNLFGFSDINEISNLKKVGFIDAIAEANRNITSAISKIKPDIIILSDIYGISPYNSVINNNFGAYNNILKYACPYDYVFYNIYAAEYDLETLSNIINKTLCSVDKNTLCLGVGHTVPTMAIAGLSDNDDFIEIVPNEYNKLLSDLRLFCNYDVIDPLSKSDLETYLNKLINS